MILAPWEEDPVAEQEAKMPPADASVPSSQSEVRKVDNALEEKASYSKMLKAKGLGTRDQNLYMSFFVPAHEQLQTERDELTLANMDELEKEIKRTKDPKSKQILVEEHGRMKTSFANILGIK